MHTNTTGGPHDRPQSHHNHGPIEGVRIKGTCPGCDLWWERMGEHLTDEQALHLKQDGVSLHELLAQINQRTPEL